MKARDLFMRAAVCTKTYVFFFFLVSWMVFEWSLFTTSLMICLIQQLTTVEVCSGVLDS